MIECVPNISDGRRIDIVDELAAVLRNTPGVRLLHQTSDPSHNRSVFTVVGERRSVSEAAVALVESALPRLDMRLQEGVHPRIGAVDVIPFVPLEGSTMAECVETARETGAAIGERLGVPVFLYAEAASQPWRRTLAEIRFGGFESLAERMKTSPWKPDFGPDSPHPTA